MTVVQLSPNVGLTLRMQRLPKATTTAASSDGGGSGGAGVGPSLLVEPWDYTAHRDIVNRTYDGWRVVGGDVEIAAELDQLFRAVYVGGSSQIEWAWDLDRSPLDEGAVGDWPGVDVVVQDGTALIKVFYGWVTGETFMYARLNLTASLNGTTLGGVSLRLAFNLYDE